MSRLKKIVLATVEVLRIPVIVTLVFENMLVTWFWLYAASMYGYYAFLGLVISEAPIIYVVVKEIRRRDSLPPRSEAFEMTTEQMERAIHEYEEMVKRKRKT